MIKGTQRVVKLCHVSTGHKMPLEPPPSSRDSLRADCDRLLNGRFALNEPARGLTWTREVYCNNNALITCRAVGAHKLVAVIKGAEYTEDETAHASWFRKARREDETAHTTDLLAQCITVRDGATQTVIRVHGQDWNFARSDVRESPWSSNVATNDATENIGMCGLKVVTAGRVRTRFSKEEKIVFEKSQD